MKTFNLILILLFQINWDTAEEILPKKLNENIHLKGYDISKTYELNDRQYISIGKNKIQNISNEGYRMIYLEKNIKTGKIEIQYLSKNKGEAYVYNPYFFEFPDGEIIIVAEEGYEYMTGIDIFKLDNTEFEYLGNIAVSSSDKGSIINQLKLEKRKSKYKFSFSGQIEYKVDTDNIINGEKLIVYYSNNEMKVELK